MFSAYLDRELGRRLCARLEAHLAGCPDCRCYYDTLQRTVVICRGLGPEKVPAGVQQRLFKILLLPLRIRPRASRPSQRKCKRNKT
jgi:hypothetical protein